MNVEQWLDEDNQLGIDIWHAKYQNGHETFDEWLDRVSGNNPAVRELIEKKKFLFGGRILANRGLAKDGRKLTYSNCYVCSPPEDNIESIFDTAKAIARTYSYGGGVGIDIGKLSPRGARINNAAKETSGAVSFMDLYSLVTGLIGQSGRRGALMISIPCNHPDLEEFIDVKSDLDKVTKANISVRITDDFMQAVKHHEEYELSFIREETGEKISKVVDAAELFRKLCYNNWNMAEPGMLFWDRIENWNLVSEDPEFRYAGTNPCFGGQNELLTVDGYKTFEELCGTEPYIVNVNGQIVKSKVWCSGVKPTVKVRTGKGEIICTPDHRFMTLDGEECQAKDLKGKYIMPITACNRQMDSRFIKYGFIQGDGQLIRLKSDIHMGIEVNIGERDTDIWDLFSDEEYSEKSGRAIYLQGFRDDMIQLGFCGENLPERTFPTTYNSWTKLQKASFLQGCYSANGCVIKHGRISYKTTCRQFAEQLAETLYQDFDIQGVYITTNKPKRIQFPNGSYDCRESYDVNIGRYKEITKFLAEINFYQQYKREQLAQMLKNRATYVFNVAPHEEVKVYDFTEPERHWGIVEGYVVHNCAEEPLPQGGSCLLGSMNLSEFVDKNGFFDLNDFANSVGTAVDGLTAVLDEGLPLHPLQEQRDSVRDWRQIGLGIFSLGDMLIKMGLTYGSPESIEICDTIGKVLADSAIRKSACLAHEHNPYPKYSSDVVLASPWFKENTTNATKELVAECGLNNSQLLTCAPTGTLSTMLGVSGGIEPIFANYYTRKTESLKGHDEYYKVYTPIVQAYMESHNITDDKDLPDYFITAPEIPYENRIKMQAVWQKHIDASISSTINLPNSATVEDVEDIYMKAWENGLKGVTIFRDGCARVGILTTESEPDQNNNAPIEIYQNTLPRGFILKADDNCIGKKRTLHTGCGTLHCEAFFDPDTGDLLETYFSRGSTGGCANSYTGLSRMISLAARGGVDVYSIVDQLKSSGVCPAYAVRSATHHDTSKGSSCPVAIGNALIDMYEELQSEIYDDEAMMPDAVKEEGVEEDNMITSKCPNCGGKLTHQGGCDVCIDCGWSKCD